MQTTVRLRANELTTDFLDALKIFTSNKNSVITVKIETKMDETEYLLSSPSNKKALEESLKSKEGFVFTFDEFKQLNKDLLKGKTSEFIKAVKFEPEKAVTAKLKKAETLETWQRKKR